MISGPPRLVRKAVRKLTRPEPSPVGPFLWGVLAGCVAVVVGLALAGAPLPPDDDGDGP